MAHPGDDSEEATRFGNDPSPRVPLECRRTARAGMNPTNIAGHSVRAGMATQAALNGSSERAIARTTRHRSRRVLRRYIRPGEMFRENASASLGL
jgi:hypothetical protein